MSNVIRCKKSGAPLATKLGGGTCVCPSIDECKYEKELKAVNEIWDKINWEMPPANGH